MAVIDWTPESYLKTSSLPNVAIKEFIPDEFFNNYPWEGIIYCGGPDHLNKAGALVKYILEIRELRGYIERIESWETSKGNVTYDYCQLLIITNVAKGLFFDNNFIQEIKDALKYDVPILITSCYELDAFEKEVSPTTLSVIEAFLLAQL